MAGILKRGAQNPWVQMLLGGLGQYSQDVKKERERQQGFADRFALMNLEQQFKAQDRSQEQELYQTKLTEQRAYTEGQTQEGHRYAEQQAEQERERKETQEQTEMQQKIAASIVNKLASFTDPEAKLTWIEENEAIYASVPEIDWERLKKQARTELNTTTKQGDEIALVRDRIAQGPREGETPTQWYLAVGDRLANLRDSKLRDDLRQTATTAYHKLEGASKPTEVQKGSMDLERQMRSQPRYGDTTPEQFEQNIQEQTRKFRLNQGGGPQADSLAAGLVPQAPGMPVSRDISGAPPGPIGMLDPSQQAALGAMMGGRGGSPGGPGGLPQGPALSAFPPAGRPGVGAVGAPGPAVQGQAGGMPPHIAAAMGVGGAPPPVSAAGPLRAPAASPEVENTAGLTPQEVEEVRTYAKIKGLSFNDARDELLRLVSGATAPSPANALPGIVR